MTVFVTDFERKGYYSLALRRRFASGSPDNKLRVRSVPGNGQKLFEADCSIREASCNNKNSFWLKKPSH
jgi:hypothetical protein